MDSINARFSGSKKKMTQQRDEVTLYKLIVVGDTETGKTQLASRFCHGQFSEQYSPTQIMDHSSKPIRDRRITTQIWDMSGQPIFKNVTTAYYQHAVGALVTYDITRVRTFQNAKKWIEHLQQTLKGDCPVILLVGNKLDLRQRRSVSIVDGSDLAKAKGVLFAETSALDGTNVDKSFLRLVDHVTNRLGQEELKEFIRVESEKKQVLIKKEAQVSTVCVQPSSKTQIDKRLQKCFNTAADAWVKIPCCWY